MTRMLEARGIPYVAHELPNEKLGAVEAAQFLGVEAERVYKTIVALRPAGGKPLLALVPGTSEVDLKALASALGEKKMGLPTQREAEEITGLQAGGISPLALMQKGFQVVIDESVGGWEHIYVSGGQRGLNIQIAPDDLIRLTKARVAEIAREV